jgi:hypothetical protein
MVGPPSEGELCLESMKIEILWLSGSKMPARSSLASSFAPPQLSNPGNTARFDQRTISSASVMIEHRRA